MDESYSQVTGIESAPLQDEVILFLASQNKFCVLNRTSTFIWQQLAEPLTKEEIAVRVGASFKGVDVRAAVSDVEAALEEMLSLGLITRH